MRTWEFFLLMSGGIQGKGIRKGNATMMVQYPETDKEVAEKDTDKEPLRKKDKDETEKEASLVDTLERIAKEGKSLLLIIKCIKLNYQQLKRKDMFPGFQTRNNTPNLYLAWTTA